MMNLVDYGSDSSDNEENSHDDEVLNGEVKDANDQSTIINKLPTVSDKPITQANQEEGELEDFLQTRKDWEKELAEEVKSEKAKPKKKTNVFGGFGSLLNKPLIDEFDDSEDITDKSEKPEPSEHKYTSSGSSLLQLLPQPNKKKATSTTNSVLLPSTLTPKQPAKRPAVPINKNVPVSKPEIDSDDEEGPTDFFGFKSSNVEVPVTSLPVSSFVPKAQIFQDAPLPGPSRPNASSNDDEAVPAKKSKRINDEIAQKLIYDAELKQWGVTDHIAREAVMNIREVNIDQELGPNVRQTLLRNLNNKSLAQASAVSLPSVKKDPQNKLSKQKHQITHLAALAVAREEQLQDQWADNKAKRISTAKRYGFR